MKIDERIALFYQNPAYPSGKELMVLINSFSEYCREMFFYQYEAAIEDMQVPYSAYSSFAQIRKKLSEKDYLGVQKIVLFDNSFFGPIASWECVFEQLRQEDDFWALEYRGAYKDEHGKKHGTAPKPYFFVVSRQVFLEEKIEDYLFGGQIHWEDFEGRLLRDGFRIGGLARERDGGADEDVEDKGIIRPYDRMKKHGLPILHKGVFQVDRISRLEFDYGDQVPKAVQYIKNSTEYDVQLIYDYLLEHFAPNEHRKFLNLDYILNRETETEVKGAVYRQSAVAMHLYYEDMFPAALPYIRNIPQQIKLFITVKSGEAREKLSPLLSFRGNCEIIVSSNIGRDWGALLLDLWPHIKRYDYICFLHDKKTSGGVGYPVVGEVFMEMAWDSLVPSPNYINQVLQLFLTDKKLGLLSPVIPYHSGYIRTLGDAWTVCLEKTKQVAAEVGIRAKIDGKNTPFALSSMFWFKRDALLPIMEYGFPRESFPKEPMPRDGTFNHALERIVIYCAQSQGYFSGTVQDISCAQNHMVNYGCMLERAVKEAVTCFGDLPSSDIFSGNNYKNRLGLLRFALENEEVYIYGTGNNGKNIAEFFSQQEIGYQGFLVSEGFKKECAFSRLPVYFPGEVGAGAGVIVAVDKRHRKDVVEALERAGHFNYFVVN